MREKVRTKPSVEGKGFATYRRGTRRRWSRLARRRGDASGGAFDGGHIGNGQGPRNARRSLQEKRSIRAIFIVGERV